MASKKPRKIRKIWYILAGMMNTVSYILLIVGISLALSLFPLLSQYVLLLDPVPLLISIKRRFPLSFSSWLDI